MPPPSRRRRTSRSAWPRPTRRYGVTVNNVAPGLIATDRTESLEADADLWLQKLGAIPLGRAGTPKDMTGIVVMLCSDAGGYITGQNIFADGGLGFPGMR